VCVESQIRVERRATGRAGGDELGIVFESMCNFVREKKRNSPARSGRKGTNRRKVFFFQKKKGFNAESRRNEEANPENAKRKRKRRNS